MHRSTCKGFCVFVFIQYSHEPSWQKKKKKPHEISIHILSVDFNLRRVDNVLRIPDDKTRSVSVFRPIHCTCLVVRRACRCSELCILFPVFPCARFCDSQVL